MSTDMVKTIFTYIIALVVILGGGVLLIVPTQLEPSELLPFLTGTIGLVLGYVFSERTNASAVSNLPTVTHSEGPPSTTRIDPA